MSTSIPVPSSLLILSVAWSSLALASPPPVNEGVLTLVDEAGYNEDTITLAVKYGIFTLTTSEVSTYTGQLHAHLDINPATGRSPVFTLLGGDIEGTAVSTYLDVLFFGAIDISTSALGGTIHTITPPGLIDPTTGGGDASQQAITLNSGTVSGTVFGDPYPYDYSETPNTIYGHGMQTVTIVPAGTSATRAIFDVTLLLPFEASEGIPNAFVDATLSSAGTYKAVGQVSVPLSDYLAWTEQQGIPGADPEEIASRSGLGNGLLWAIGLGIDDDPEPHLLRPDPAEPGNFILTLPAGGCAGPLFIESSTSLAPGSWAPATLSLPTNPLPAGTLGQVTITSPGSFSRYFRLRADP